MQNRSVAETLPHLLASAAAEHPERGIAIFDARGRTHERRTYAQLLEDVRRGGARLRAAGIEPGDRVLICLPTSWEWMEIWLGCIWIGALPVAMAPPGALGSSEGYGERLQALSDRLQVRHVIGGEMMRRDLTRFELPAVERLLTPDELAALDAREPGPPAPARPDEIAFLQLTSGSTGLSRAVMIPHQAVLHNNRSSNEAIGAPWGAPAASWADGMVAWLPMNHDMGLVGCLFLSVHLGLDLWLLQPTTFLARPRLWLEQLGQHGKVFAPAPNFGYQLCVERIRAEQLDGLDLSGWRAAMTGAEMIHPETARAFAALTERCGFRPEAFRPCYGLAEGTLAVTFDRAGQGLRTRPLPDGADTGLGLNEVVSVGTPVRDTELRIVAPDGGSRPAGQIGEVRVKGPGVFAGYYNDDEATAEGLQDGWLCTGDLGFVHDGELYLTGRVKDVLIIHGNNVMPHELEWMAEQVAGGGGASRSGAFSVAGDEQGEQAVLVIETSDKDDTKIAAMEQEIRKRIGRAMGLPLADVVFVKRGRIPKTTSGKVQRRQLRQLYLDRQLHRLDHETGD